MEGRLHQMRYDKLYVYMDMNQFWDFGTSLQWKINCIKENKKCFFVISNLVENFMRYYFDKITVL